MTDITAPYNIVNDSTIMSLFILNIIGISYVLLMNGTSIVEGVKNHFYYKRTTASFNDRTHITKICNALMYMQTLFYTGILAMSFMMEANSPLLQSGPFTSLGTGMLFAAAILLFKNLAYAIVNNILFTSKESKEWQDLYFFTIKLLGFALAPAVIVILFAPPAYTNYAHYYLILIIITYIYIVINGLTKIIFTKKRNYLDIFLYLCALEFLPIAMALKFAEQMSDFIIIKS